MHIQRGDLIQAFSWQLRALALQKSHWLILFACSLIRKVRKKNHSFFWTKVTQRRELVAA
jgi:hypothetical protein